MSTPGTVHPTSPTTSNLIYLLCGPYLGCACNFCFSSNRCMDICGTWNFPVQRQCYICKYPEIFEKLSQTEWTHPNPIKKYGTLATDQLYHIAISRWRLVLYFPDTAFHTFFSGQVSISSDIHVVRTFPDMSGARPSCWSWPDCSLRPFP